jgi:hypothetical protein
VSDDIEVLTFSRTPTGWAVVERDAVMERLGLTSYDVDLEEYEAHVDWAEEQQRLAIEAWYEGGRDD